MRSELEQSYRSLAAWCRARDYAGYDPFDGLNSRVFQATPFSRSRVARLIWTQTFKRSPINLRKLAGVPAERNAKGIALFALASLSRFRASRCEETRREACDLIDSLIDMRLSGWHGAAWGYNFDWQGRAFFAPRGTPTIVPTAFAARALLEAWQAFGTRVYLDYARSACDFILHDLQRSIETPSEVCFSYSPLDQTRVFNASLLAAEILATVGSQTGEKELSEWGRRAVRYVVRQQRVNGSWAYGAEDYQSWADNFHTAFILTSLRRIMMTSGIEHRDENEHDEWSRALQRGLEFWQQRFFLADGRVKYYHTALYPIDLHATGAALVALTECRSIDPNGLALAEKVAAWAIRGMQNAQGYFYYQQRRFYTVRIPYMRWTQAWMLYGLARLMEEFSILKQETGDRIQKTE